ncbi:MAG: sodium:solute symporter [Deltaproteobacteria bacterium]|nr:sodium:solute symporter [Deltaproteobacteria bacterium]MBU54148.1 sodium:solute symporter [Deltaproteobacteria bacterium]
MTTTVMTWIALGLYAALTAWLTIRSVMKTQDLKSFSIGSGDIPPALIGLSLIAQLTSVATFVINPGFIYFYGVSGLMGLGFSAALGITLGLIFFSARFRKVGTQVAALTLPQWIGARYNSVVLRLIFSVLSLALITFAVLIVVGVSLVLAGMLNIKVFWVISGLVIFVLSYVMIGGANTHAYTNAIQAVIMLIVALILIGSGVHYFFQDGGLLGKIATINPNLTTLVNPKSLYFRNFFEVFICNFLVGLAIVCQPHIVSKSLYLKEDSHVRQYLTVALIAGIVFLGVMVVGLYARVALPPQTKLDMVVPHYIAATFAPWLKVVISIGLLCAGLSTLEGILLALSGIFSSDIYLTFLAKDEDENQNRKKALAFGRTAMVVVAIVTIWLARWQVNNPSGGSVAIFAQYGVYLLFTTAFFPLACGMFLPKVSREAVTAGVISAFITYLVVAFNKITFMSNNPAFLATCALIVGWCVIGIVTMIKPNAEESATSTKEETPETSTETEASATA